MRDPDERAAADGTITTGVARSRVPQPFEPVLSTAVEAIAEAGCDASAFLYGSVATGRARHAQSDVDLLTVGLGPGRAAELGRELSSQFSGLCRGVEIAAASRTTWSARPTGRMGSGSSCVTTASISLAPTTLMACPGSSPTTGRRAASTVTSPRTAARWRDALAAWDEPWRLGRRLARKTLLAVAGLVSILDATWTTDRALAAHRWAEIEPELGPALHALLAWSDGLVLPGRQAVQHMLDNTTPRITAAFARTIGLWPRTAAGSP